MGSNYITVLVVRVGERPKIEKIDASLISLHRIVGGHIKTCMPFDDNVVVVYNKNGKLKGFPLNRAIYNKGKKMLDVIAGDFLICGISTNNEFFLSLSDELVGKYFNLFKYPQSFYYEIGAGFKVINN